MENRVVILIFFLLLGANVMLVFETQFANVFGTEKRQLNFKGGQSYYKLKLLILGGRSL